MTFEKILMNQFDKFEPDDTGASYSGPYDRVIDAICKIAEKMGADPSNTGNRLADALDSIAENYSGGSGGGNSPIYRILRVCNAVDKQLSGNAGGGIVSFSSDELDVQELYRNENIAVTDNSIITRVTNLDGNPGYYQYNVVPEYGENSSGPYLNANIYKYSEGSGTVYVQCVVVEYYCGESAFSDKPIIPELGEQESHEIT